MTNRLLTGLIAATFAASLAVASPVLARGGGGGFGGGGHGGFGGGHFGGGGMHMGGMGMGGAHFGGAHFGGGHFGGAHFGGARFAGGPMGAHAAFAPRFAGAGWHGRSFIGRHAFFHHHHRHFAVFGAPFLYAGYGYYDGCWQRNWTPWGWRWVNACGDAWY